MTDITFARTRHFYHSYKDFFRLAELCGYPICYVDEIDAYDSSKAYIISPLLESEWFEGWPDAKARIVLWDLEWREECPQIPGVEVWAADKWYANKIGVRHVPMGSHPDLVPFKATSVKPSYDVAMLAYMIGRRNKIFGDLQRTLRIAPSENMWGDDRDNMFRYTSVLLHVHQHDNFPTVAPGRFALAAAAKTFLISEQCADPFPYRPGQDFIQAPYHSLVGTVRGLHANRNLAMDMGTSLYYQMCEHNRFDKCIERAL